MTWNYDPTNIGTDTPSKRLNAVRLLIGDTDTNNQILQDEEISFGLSQNSTNVYFTASWCCKVIASKYSSLVDVQLDGALSSKYSDLQKQYLRMADELEEQAKASSGFINVYAGGISKTAVDNVRQNTDRIEPSFRRDRFWNPPSYSGNDYSEDY